MGFLFVYVGEGCYLCTIKTTKKIMWSLAVLVFSIITGGWVASQVPTDWIETFITNERAAKIVQFIISAICFLLGFALGQYVLLLCVIIVIYFVIVKK
jgi:hypothetical protein